MTESKRGTITTPSLRCWSDLDREGDLFEEPVTLREVFVHRDDMPALEPLLAPYRERDPQNSPLIRLTLDRLNELAMQSRLSALEAGK